MNYYYNSHGSILFCATGARVPQALDSTGSLLNCLTSDEMVDIEDYIVSNDALVEKQPVEYTLSDDEVEPNEVITIYCAPGTTVTVESSVVSGRTVIDEDGYTEFSSDVIGDYAITLTATNSRDVYLVVSVI